MDGSGTHGSPFPFTRLAVSRGGGGISSEVYFYHQLNESAFGEEIFEASGNAWISNVISVETSS